MISVLGHECGEGETKETIGVPRCECGEGERKEYASVVVVQHR